MFYVEPHNIFTGLLDVRTTVNVENQEEIIIEQLSVYTCYVYTCYVYTSYGTKVAIYFICLIKKTRIKHIQ